MAQSSPSIEFVLGDITTERVDAIVNAANARLAGGGGVDGAVHRAAGWSELDQACRAIGYCEPGAAVVTPGFKLQARWIIHTVGPVWHGGSDGEPETLASCYRSVLAAADGVRARFVAIPALSTGSYGYPGTLAAAIALRTVRSCTTNVALVRFVAFDRDTLEVYLALA